MHKGKPHKSSITVSGNKYGSTKSVSGSVSKGPVSVRKSLDTNKRRTTSFNINKGRFSGSVRTSKSPGSPRSYGGSLTFNLKKGGKITKTKSNYNGWSLQPK